MSVNDHMNKSLSFEDKIDNALELASTDPKYDLTRLSSRIDVLEDLESQLDADLEAELADLGSLEEDYKSISNPESIGQTVLNVVWEQFLNQIAVTAGEDFIRENRGLNLDLRKSAHTQTTENFAQGNIATHNTHIDYQERYDTWQSKFERNPDGSIKTHKNRMGQVEENVKSSARAAFDMGRPVGSKERGTDMDHTVGARRIIGDAGANAHLSEAEQVAFANSSKNLNEMDSSHNRSKGSLPMTDWLDNPNSNGQKPCEIFDIDEKLDRQYREKDREASQEYERVKKEGEKRSQETGKQSRKEEAFRMGGKALRSVLMGLLANLLKTIGQKLVKWLSSAKKSWDTFVAHVKDAIKKFISELKQHLISAADSLFTTLATSIFGPIIGFFKKLWILLKQGYKSVKEAVNYLRDKNNRNKPLSIIMLEISKIVVAGLTAAGALVLGEVIEKSLISIPLFAFPIPLLGSLASILGLFLGGLVSALGGAVVLNIIDRAIAKKKKKLLNKQIVDKQNQIRTIQHKQMEVSGLALEANKEKSGMSIKTRHEEADRMIHSSVSRILKNNDTRPSINNDDALDSLFDSISKL